MREEVNQNLIFKIQSSLFVIARSYGRRSNLGKIKMQNQKDIRCMKQLKRD